MENRIRELRKEKNLTQTQVGEMLGVQQSAIRKYEFGEVNIPQDKITRLADFFDVTVDYLLGKSTHKTAIEAFVSAYNIPSLGSAMHDFSDPRTQRMIEIINFADCLSEEGQNKVVEYVKDLYSSDKYKIKEVVSYWIEDDTD